MTGLTDVPGVRAANLTLDGTGVTVIVLPEGTVASCEVRGGAPASRETALLDPTKLVEHVDRDRADGWLGVRVGDSRRRDGGPRGRGSWIPLERGTGTDRSDRGDLRSGRVWWSATERGRRRARHPSRTCRRGARSRPSRGGSGRDGGEVAGGGGSCRRRAGQRVGAAGPVHDRHARGSERSGRCDRGGRHGARRFDRAAGRGCVPGAAARPGGEHDPRGGGHRCAAHQGRVPADGRERTRRPGPALHPVATRYDGDIAFAASAPASDPANGERTVHLDRLRLVAVDSGGGSRPGRRHLTVDA